MTNIDASILNLKLEHDFKITVLSEKEAFDFIKEVDKVPLREAGKIIVFKFPCLNFQERKVYVIDNSIEVDEKTTESEFNIIAQFDNNFVHGYLNPTLQLMRLFKEGDLRMPYRYFYNIEHGKPSSNMSMGDSKFCSREKYCIENSELTGLNIFLHETKLPFKKDFLQLAFENFNLSYEISNTSLSFLTLMISLETLFNPGGGELVYRISRNAAVLLGTNMEESEKTFTEIKQLYQKRSIVVHTGKTNSVKRENLLKLRHYVRESIKKMYLIKKNKKEILELLTSSGFENNIA